MALLGKQPSSSPPRQLGPGPLPQALVDLGLRRELPGGGCVFRQGEEAKSCFYLERGEVLLRKLSRSGAEVEIGRLAEGDWFGEAVLFASGLYPADAFASRDSTLMEFRREAIVPARDPSVATYFLSLLAGKCLSLNRRIEVLTIMDSRERLARFILSLCPGRLSGCEGGGKDCSVPLPRRKREIALELGMAPETLSRCLRQFEEEGLIRVRGMAVEIPSCPALMDVAGA